MEKDLPSRQRIKSYWERQVLQLRQAYDFVVVGAGFMGLWVAFQLVQKYPDKNIVVVQKDVFTLGASSRNAGFITISQISQLYADSKHGQESVVFQTTLKRLLGLQLAKRYFGKIVQNCGSFDYDIVTKEKVQFMDRLNSYLQSHCGLKPFQLKNGRLGDGQQRQCFYNSSDGKINPVKLLKLLRQKLISSERVCFMKDEVKQCRDGAAVTASNRVIKYERAFLCINAFKNKVILGGVKIHPGRGQVIVTSVLKDPPKSLGYLNEGYDYWRSVDGRLLLGGGRHLFRDQQNSFNFQVERSKVRAYLQNLARRILGKQEFTVEYHWGGIMGFLEGSHSGEYVERVDQQTVALFGCSGMGVALSPYVAEKVVSDLDKAKL